MKMMIIMIYYDRIDQNTLHSNDADTIMKKKMIKKDKIR